MSDHRPKEDRLELSRRGLLKMGAVAGATVPLSGLVLGSRAAAAEDEAPGADGDFQLDRPGKEVEELTIAEMTAAMAAGTLTSSHLVDVYLERIAALDQSGPGVNAVLEVNPRARQIAADRDAARRAGRTLGPLHGVPILLKGNIDTHDGMSSTAGSLALLGAPPDQDATVAARLRAAGAILLGKANLSEWANFRGFNSTSGWSGQGGLTRNPYVLDRNACGSSSGSGAGVAASFCAAALGTETDGSIVCPASINGVVGIKPTVGLTSRAGVIPISHTQDTVGPHGRTVADAAAVLGALVGVDPRDPATAGSAGRFHADYTQFLDPDGLRGARIGVARGGGFTGYSAATDAVFEEALAAMTDAGAILVDPAEIPSIDALNADQAEITVLIYEFKRDVNAYLATRHGIQAETLAELIQFNLDHADRELQFFGQEFFELSEQEIFTEAEYLEALVRGRSLAREQGIDKALTDNNLVALVAPTGSPSWTSDLVNGDHFLGASSGPCAVAGYPIINVPAGSHLGLPIGISFMGTAYSEPNLIKVASGFEHVVQGRQAPRYRLTIGAPRPTGPAFSRNPGERLARILERKRLRLFGL